MRYAICFVALSIVILLQPAAVLAYHDMTCHEPPPPYDQISLSLNLRYSFPSDAGEEYNLILLGSSGATSASCSGAGDDPHVVLPPDDLSAMEHVPGTGEVGRFWLFEPVSQPFRDAHNDLLAALPNFTKPDGAPLLTQYSETNLDFVLSTARTFTPGEAFSVSTGQIDTWPGATLLEMPASFTLDELLAADPSQFPLYTGAAEVGDIATLEVFQAVPEPASLVSMTLAIVVCVLAHFPRGHKSDDANARRSP